MGDQVRVLQKALVALFLRNGSVNKLCVLLNGLLSNSGEHQKIYPNRLHALLSGDAARTINEKTLELIRSAVALSDWDAQSVEAGEAKLAAEVEHRWIRCMKTRGDVRRISAELSIPPVVVEFLLRRASLLPAADSDATPIFAAANAKQRGNGFSVAPDYTFQKVAVRRCRAALRKGGGRRIGLVSPTGSGKTEMALQIALEELHESPRKNTKVIWVTHRQNLRKQAHERLQKMLLRGFEGIPEDASSLLAHRVEFVMVREAHERIHDEPENVELVIIDEAHHAAAGSYDPIFESVPPLSVLALTATPNRTDGLPIRIDEIAFTITFAELVERGVILMPEFVEFPVPQFDWTSGAVDDLADHLIENTTDKYLKVLVIAPQIERVEEFYRALIKRLAEEQGHVLSEDDVGFVHSKANSSGLDSGTFIENFCRKPRGILVSAQMLLEGFDDPQIDTVVITYPTSSLITLMQAAGRCVRQSPGKRAAYVIQARDDRASYYFEQRWLYQDISDFPRPQLENIEYRNPEELEARLGALLSVHNVSAATKAEIQNQFNALIPGETCRLLLAGLPYFGERSEFATKAKWTGALLTGTTKAIVTSAFNEFCSRGYPLTQVQHLGPVIDDLAWRLNFGTLASGNKLRAFLSNLFVSTQNAVREVYGHDPDNYVSGSRPAPECHSTSWLKYITFEYRPSIPASASVFLAECVNRSEIAWRIESSQTIAVLLRVPLPLSGFEAFALTEAQGKAFDSLRDRLMLALRTTSGLQQLATAASFLAIQDAPEIPKRLYEWMDMFSRDDFMAANSLSFAPNGATQQTQQIHNL